MMKSDDDFSELLGEATTLAVKGRAALAEGNASLAYELLLRKHDLVLRVFGATSGYAGTSLIDLAEALHLMDKNNKTKEARTNIDAALEIY
jgi:hypothetical protein